MPRPRADRRALPPLLLSAYVGLHVKVHLKDDRVLSGILDTVHGDMGLILGKCTGVFEEGPLRKQAVPMTELAFVSGKLVRMVVLPDDRVEDHLKRAWRLKTMVRGQQAGRTISDKKPSSSAF